MGEDLPVCSTASDIPRLAGARVCVVGIYQLVDLRQKPTPPPRFQGHAAVALENGALVLLEPPWSRVGQRPEAERTEWEGRTVEAVGVLHQRCPEPREPVATLINPCLSPVERISAHDQRDVHA
jgi:hypothetical protein